MGEHAWAHMDIAGTNWWEAGILYTNKPYYMRGSTVVGVRTLIGMLQAWDTD